MKILFVCSGNTCRSPMAEGYLKSLKLNGVMVSSAGLQVGEYSRVSESSVAAMKEMGIDISAHRPRRLTREITDNSDKIICMTATHKAILEIMGVQGEILVLGGGISDPYGSDEETYISCRNEIIYEIDRLLNSVIVRRFKSGDEKSIAEIEKESFSMPWSEQAILSAEENGTTFLIAEKGFKTAGYISVNTVLDEGYINNIAVKKEFRRQGVANKLLKALAKTAQESELSFLSLEVRKSNRAAISLYEKNGYENKGIRKNFYENPKEDAVIMTKTMRD